MKPTAYRLKQSPPPSATFVVATIYCVIALFSTASCSSLCHREKALDRTLAAQVQLIEKLSSERQSEPLKAKVRKDAQLSVAERHLNASLEALLDSIKTVRAKFSEKQEGVANGRNEQIH